MLAFKEVKVEGSKIKGHPWLERIRDQSVICEKKLQNITIIGTGKMAP